MTQKKGESSLFGDPKKLGLGYSCREILQTLHILKVAQRWGVTFRFQCRGQITVEYQQ